ncbi:hypothetical protein MRB53_037306 [Persea americana]|nr:hypothetical protein MRB53_037306 [Persea americana]
MLEGLVSNLLNRVLGMYVRNFDPKQLSIGIWSGDVKLRNLELRREALDQLKLPLNVIEGHLGTLTLSIPWSNLRGKPVKVNIEDVFILAAPKEDAEYDAEEEERRAQALKMEKLESAELLKERNTEGLSKEEAQKQQSFTASLTTAIIDNLQISVQNIHVRYEDSISAPGHPFAAGVTLKDFSAVSTDEEWKPTFIQSTSGSTHKLAKLGAFAVYWDTDTKLLVKPQSGGDTLAAAEDLSHDDLLDRFRSLIVQSEEALGDHQFILKPVSGQAGVEIDKSGKTDRPHINTRVFFDELGFVLDEDQYRDALMLVDLFHYFIRHQEYKKLQPKSSPKEDPKAWLLFAGKAVLDRIHDRNRRWTWAYFKERRDDRLRYITLFKKRKREETLSATETSELKQLEEKLSYEDLRFWRSLARNQLRKENVGVKKAPAKQSWSSWVWGAKKEEETPDDTQMSEEQRKELYSAIDWDEKKALAESVDLPRETVKMQAHLSLKTGSFTLKRDPHGKADQILRLLFDSFSTNLLQRPDSLLAQVSLQGMRLYDGTTEGSLFPQIIKIKDAPEEARDRVEDVTDMSESEISAMKLDGGDHEAKAEKAFFALSFEQNPLDGHADSALRLKLKGMEIVYNPKFLVEVAKFFKPPERHMESIGALMETAGATVEGIRKQTRAGLEFALEEHKTVDAQLDIQAPLIIIPDSVTQKSSLCLILDAGHASVASELVSKDTIREVQAKQKQKYTEEDYENLERLMYDKFTLKLESTQLLIGPSIEATRAQLSADSDAKNLHLIDRINMDFLVEICIVPKGSNLTKFRITGKLPVLHASISDSKYKNLMRLLEVAIPKFDGDPVTKEVTNGAQGPSNLKKPASTAKDDTIISRPRSKSFQYSAMEHDLVLDDNDDEHVVFSDAQSGEDPSDVSIHQRNFEFKFVVEKLQGSLYRSDSEDKKDDQLLAELIAEGFALDFYQRAFDMVAELSLKTLVLEDHVEESATPEFKNIVSSEDTSDTSHDADDLFKLKFVKVNPDSPEFMNVYEGIATNLQVAVSTINLIVTRKTLLTLLDFVLVTFTNPDASPDAAEDQKSIAADATEEAANSPPVNSDRIRIRAELKTISIILNNDGIRLATLTLSTATVALMLMGKTMRVGAKLGNMTLVDDINQGAAEDSSLRQLLTIQGDELADFSYETFDAASEVYPGHDSAVKLKSGSIKVNFMTEPFRKIMDFGVKFGKMQAIFNAARQAAANQANQIQERANRMHFDILIRTPIVVFPRIVVGDKPQRDILTAYLGEIYANNKFVPLDDSEQSETSNQLTAGIRNVRLTSLLHYNDNQSEELELIDKVDLGFDVNYVEHKPGLKRPDLEVTGTLSDINLRMSSQQLKLLLEVSKSVPAAFAADADGDVAEEVREELPTAKVDAAKAVSTADGKPGDAENVVHLGPELGTDADKWTKIDLVFKAGAIALELLQDVPDSPIGDLESASLSKFSLNQTNVKLRMISDGSMESELLIESFTIRDTRKKESNKFRKIMSLINNDIKQQFMANVTISGGNEPNMLVILTVDSPRLILALEYLFALQTFTNQGLAVDDNSRVEDILDESVTEHSESDAGSGPKVLKQDGETSEKKTASEPGMAMSFRVSMIAAQVVFLANPAITSSEAVVLGMKQVVVAKQHATTLQVEEVGMFLCRMDKFETSRLRVLDDFSIATSLDMRSTGASASLTNIHVDIEPLVLRLSLRDILLVMQIVAKASELSGSTEESSGVGTKRSDVSKKTKQIEAQTARSTHRRTASTYQSKTVQSIKTQKTKKPDQIAQAEGSTILKREEMSIALGGIRVVLIGDAHELPMLDWSVKSFNIDVRDWSGAMSADMSTDMFINIYNFSKSSWEPLIEPWTLGFHMSRAQGQLAIDLFSRKSLEISLTSASIALASNSFQFLSGDEDVLSKPRGSDAPYRIRNYTGFNVNVWAHVDKGPEGAAAKIDEGQEVPWRFEDPTTTRETLAPEGAGGSLGIVLEGSGFDSIERIAVSREGEKIYNLSPRKDKVMHRLLVEVKLGDDRVKYITFRSPLLVENHTHVPIELGIYSPDQGLCQSSLASTVQIRDICSRSRRYCRGIRDQVQ